MILLRRYRLRQSGIRGHLITVPEEYVEGVGLATGQKIAIYRDGDRLILVPEKKEARS